jgi:hypothetical protein
MSSALHEQSIRIRGTNSGMNDEVNVINAQNNRLPTQSHHKTKI